MEIVQPRSLIRRLLRLIEECGGVIDVFFVALDHELCSADELHRDAAALAIRALKQQMEKQSEQLAKKYGRRREDVFRMTLEPGYVPVGKRISIDAFLNGPPSFNQDFVAGGLVHAFCDPPHGIRGDEDRLLRVFNRAVLHDISQNTEVWDWEPRGSNYFDAGKEWWGSFFWTVRPPKARIIVALFASTTD